ncbi:MAG: FtsX-like permease family protein [Thermoanaerobaculaceae bacterium]|nr:FtsX-like permease family protein [Thermoanaerobaculaceae bacterium]MDI9621532.1 FtsX-like permease family protein [Acidobacteriota bacterium]NLH11525.1 FtsX-like permease family protein [Holophagae bacterium]
MRVLLLLVGRYLGGLRRRTHVAAVSSISFGAMALGAAALVLTLALLEGFQHTIRVQLSERGVHAMLRPRHGSTLPTGDWLARLRARHPELEFRALAGGSVWCTVPGEATPAELEVVDSLTRVEVNRVLAARLGVGAGTWMAVASPHLVLTPLGPLPLRSRVEIGAVTALRPGEDRAIIRVGPQLGTALLGQVGPRVVEVRSSDPMLAWDVASRVHADVPDGVEVVSFRDLNRPLLAALQLERVMIGFGVALIMAVAALNLLCNLTLLAAEKRLDGALLQAMGLESGSLRRLFVLIGLVVGAAGGVVGTAVGAVAAWVLDATHALPLPAGIFIVSHVPFRVTPGAAVVVLGVSLVAAVAASLPPALAAARGDVVEGLRYE